MWGNALSNWKPAMQRKLSHLALHYNTHKHTSEYTGGKEKIEFRHLSHRAEGAQSGKERGKIAHAHCTIHAILTCEHVYLRSKRISVLRDQDHTHTWGLHICTAQSQC